MQRVIVWTCGAVIAVSVAIVTLMPSPCTYDWRECVDVHQLVEDNQQFSKAQTACKRMADRQVGSLNWPSDPFAETWADSTMQDDGRFAYIEDRTSPTVICGYDMTSGSVTSVRTGR